MKKRTVVLISLLVALLLMGSAYALWTESVSVTVTANSATMDIRIVSRQVPTVNGSITEVAANTDSLPGDSVSETINTFAPGEDVTFTYQIENNGTVPVHLSAVDFSIDTANAILEPETLITWTITDSDATPVGNGGKTLTAEDASSYTFNLGDGVTIDGDLGTNDYCTLVLNIELDETDPEPYTSTETVEFTLSPVYTQNS